ncbi:MAG: hypothetical protein Q9201_006607 [Fulgogasparrea decipioides]
MPRPKAIASLSAPADADVDEDSAMIEALPTPESNQENTGPTGKGRGRGKATANTTTKAKSKARRASAGSLAGKKKAVPKKTGSRRPPLKEQQNNRNPEDTEEVDDFDHDDGDEGQGQQSAVSADELVAVKQPVKKTRTAAKRKNPTSKKQTDSETLQQLKGTTKDGEFEYTPVTARQTKPTKKAPGRPPANQANASLEPQNAPKGMSEKVIPDTQDVIMEVGPSDIPLHSEEDEEVPQSVFRRTNNAQSKQHGRQPPLIRRTDGADSDTENGGGDPALRRKLGEMTKKFENLDLKYKRLKDVGIKDAEANFEKLRLSSEAKSKAANELIASLKKELTTQKALAQESRTLQKQLAAKDADVSKAQAFATELSNSLSEAQNENKVLQAKIASARAASTAIESASSKTPGSAIKGKGPVRTVMVGSAEAAQAAQAAQLKEDLYRDLTGLLVLGVDKGAESDVYDCIQTGRNGTLHFKLGIATNTGDSYEETEFQYTPRLDNDRDRDLLELLPDYLSEEITFSRLNAAKFYGRVVETLTRKRAEDD